MRIACWIPKATNTHSEFVIIIDFQPQQRLYESALILRYTYLPVFFLLYLFFPPFLCFLHSLLFFFRKVTISSVTRMLCSAIHLTLFYITHFDFLNKAIIKQTNQSKNSHSLRYKICFVLVS